MASLGSIPLNAQGFQCGAAFPLATAARASAKLRFNAAEVETHENQKDVVIRFSGTSDPVQVLEKGHELAQRGLDLLSMLGQLDAVTTHADEEHILWWLEGKVLVVRLVSTTLLNFSVPPVRIEVRDKAGNLVPQAAVVPQHHIGFRYFRLAQTSDDLYEAYRNMYLAFEVLLSSQHPIRPKEREGDWLKRALTQAGSAIQLSDLLPAPPPSDVEAGILDLIYYDARLPLFHAKIGRDFYPPADTAANREIVSKALQALTHIVIRMAESWFKARRVRGGVFFAWVYAQAAKVLTDAAIIVSDDSSPFDATERDLTHSRFETAPKLMTRLAPELQKGRAPALFGSADVVNLKGLSIVRRIEVIKPTSPFMSQHLDSELSLDGLGRLEAIMHVEATNLTEPKSRFKV